MQWYYAKDGQPVGPLADNDFRALIFKGTITRQTLVWHEGLKDWTPYGRIPPEAAPGGKPPLHLTAPAHPVECGRCGTTLDLKDMVEIDGAYVCPDCHPVVMQAAQEPVVLNYAGFWIRFLAKLIDALILGATGAALAFVAGLGTAAMLAGGRGVAGTVLIFGLVQVLQIAIALGYGVFFVGRFGATPGKMALSLRIIRADGGRVSYARAAGRYFAEWISGAIFCIGYIMAGFDDEKRALHDRICDTRVVRA